MPTKNMPYESIFCIQASRCNIYACKHLLKIHNLVQKIYSNGTTYIIENCFLVRMLIMCTNTIKLLRKLNKAYLIIAGIHHKAHRLKENFAIVNIMVAVEI